jgi:hypothetical protein
MQHVHTLDYAPCDMVHVTTRCAAQHALACADKLQSLKYVCDCAWLVLLLAGQPAAATGPSPRAADQPRQNEGI